MTVAIRCFIVSASLIVGSVAAPFVITQTVDSGGGRGASASYTNHVVIGGFGGFASGASPAVAAKSGYLGQIYDLTALDLNASPLTINEGNTRELRAAVILDDTTLLVPAPSEIGWSVVSGPIFSVTAGGLATASVVYQNTIATVRGTFLSLSDTLELSVLNVGQDDFGIYAGDQITDDWQVRYFGENNPNAGPTIDPDGDGQNNRFEFIAGLAPSDPASVFRLRIEGVPNRPAQKNLVISPRLSDRVYEVQFRLSLTAGIWQPLIGATHVDNGLERTVTDANASEVAKFYRIEITLP